MWSSLQLLQLYIKPFEISKSSIVTNNIKNEARVETPWVNNNNISTDGKKVNWNHNFF